VRGVEAVGNRDRGNEEERGEEEEEEEAERIRKRGAFKHR